MGGADPHLKLLSDIQGPGGKFLSIYLDSRFANRLPFSNSGSRGGKQDVYRHMNVPKVMFEPSVELTETKQFFFASGMFNSGH